MLLHFKRLMLMYESTGDNGAQRSTAETSPKHRGWFHFKTTFFCQICSLALLHSKSLHSFSLWLVSCASSANYPRECISDRPVFLILPISKIISAIFGISGHFKFYDGSQGKPYLGLYQISSLQALLARSALGG